MSLKSEKSIRTAGKIYAKAYALLEKGRDTIFLLLRKLYFHRAFSSARSLSTPTKDLLISLFDQISSAGGQKPPEVIETGWRIQPERYGHGHSVIS